MDEDEHGTGHVLPESPHVEPLRLLRVPVGDMKRYELHAHRLVDASHWPNRDTWRPEARRVVLSGLSRLCMAISSLISLRQAKRASSKAIRHNTPGWFLMIWRTSSRQSAGLML